MLSMNNINDKQKMMEYYRTSDMLNLLYFFSTTKSNKRFNYNRK